MGNLLFEFGCFGNYLLNRRFSLLIVYRKNIFSRTLRGITSVSLDI